MQSRFAMALIFAGIASVSMCRGQQGIGGVLVLGASTNDGYGGWTTCGDDGKPKPHKQDSGARPLRLAMIGPLSSPRWLRRQLSIQCGPARFQWPDAASRAGFRPAARP